MVRSIVLKKYALQQSMHAHCLESTGFKVNKAASYECIYCLLYRVLQYLVEMNEMVRQIRWLILSTCTKNLHNYLKSKGKKSG